MRSSSSSSSKNVWPLVRYTFLGLLLIIVSACARKPNLVPFGYGEIFSDPVRASTAARVDYPIVYTVDPNAKYITFRVSEYGERVWFWDGEFWDQPIWKSVKWYQINLITQYKVPHKSICLTEYKNPAGTGDVTEIRCMFNVKDYLSKPLIALLDYYMDGDEKNPPGDNNPATGNLPRIYYLISEDY